MQQLKNLNIYKFLYFIKKKNNKIDSINTIRDLETKKEDCDFYLRLNRRTASLLTCSLAFITRHMYYYRVEDINIWDYLDKQDFENTYNDLRYMLLYLDKKSESIYKNYKNFKIHIDK